MTTVALSLLAYDLSGGDAGAVLGAVFALKMIAYVGLAPVIAAYAPRFDRRRLLIALDAARVAIVACLPFVSEVWQVLVLVFALNACAAGFTPAFQATIPDVLPDDDDYTRALSLSRVAYDLGELLSPVVAAGLLLLVDFHTLFAVDAASFVVSAALVSTTRLTSPPGAAVGGRTLGRITFGIRRYLATPRLRGLLALNLAVASASAMTIVNTVVLVRDEFGGSASAVAVAFACAGAGSMLVALRLPHVLGRLSDRRIMLTGAILLPIGLIAAAATPSYGALLPVWFLIGLGLSFVQTPAGRLIQRSGSPGEHPALFAAQFSLSHACWLVTYPVAGILGAAIGTRDVAIVLAIVASTAILVAVRAWRPTA